MRKFWIPVLIFPALIFFLSILAPLPVSASAVPHQPTFFDQLAALFGGVPFAVIYASGQAGGGYDYRVSLDLVSDKLTDGQGCEMIEKLPVSSLPGIDTSRKVNASSLVILYIRSGSSGSITESEYRAWISQGNRGIYFPDWWQITDDGYLRFKWNSGSFCGGYTGTVVFALNYISSQSAPSSPLGGPVPTGTGGSGGSGSVSQSCVNGALNYPICDQCPTGQVLSGASCQTYVPPYSPPPTKICPDGSVISVDASCPVKQMPQPPQSQGTAPPQTNPILMIAILVAIVGLGGFLAYRSLR